jgi:hypothetical protein
MSPFDALPSLTNIFARNSPRSTFLMSRHETEDDRNERR